MAQDIPLMDETVASLPTDVREDLAERGKNDLFLFGRGILGYHDMTERCHLPLCVFLESNPAQFLEILMPRDHFKTSVVTIAGSMQKVIRNPEERMLIANESSTNAQRFLRSIRQHAESNRVFRALYSDSIPKNTRTVRWNDNELDFNREGHYPEPTIDTIGMTGAMTSRHYTHMTFDDVISEEALKSEKVMNDTIERMKAIQSLMVKPNLNTVWLVGTRWALWDVYAWYEQSFGSRLGRFVRSAIEDGELIFPELISWETLALKRQTLGAYKFSCLMMNNPRNSDVQDLNIQDLRYYDLSADETYVRLLDKDGAEVRRWYIEQLDVSVAVDLAPAETGSSDRNAITTVGVSPLGELILLDLFAQRCTPLEVIQHLFLLKRKYYPRVFGIEGVAYQKAFKYFVKQAAANEGLYLRIEELSAVGKKEHRIRGLQPIMATGKMFVHPRQQMLIQEMSEFPLGKHDDTIDSLSMHLQMLRGRASPEHLAKVDVEVNRMINQIKLRGNRFNDGTRRKSAIDEQMREAFRGEIEYEEMTLRDRERVGGFDEAVMR